MTSIAWSVQNLRAQSCQVQSVSSCKVSLIAARLLSPSSTSSINSLCHHRTTSSSLSSSTVIGRYFRDSGVSSHKCGGRESAGFKGNIYNNMTVWDIWVYFKHCVWSYYLYTCTLAQSFLSMCNREPRSRKVIRCKPKEFTFFGHAWSARPHEWIDWIQNRWP